MKIRNKENSNIIQYLKVEKPQLPGKSFTRYCTINLLFVAQLKSSLM